jgi:hypothetical protein
MAGITLENAQAQLDLYLEAERAVLLNQEYEIAGRRLKRADLESIQIGIKSWDARVKQLAGVACGRRRNRTIVGR